MVELMFWYSILVCYSTWYQDRNIFAKCYKLLPSMDTVTFLVGTAINVSPGNSFKTTLLIFDTFLFFYNPIFVIWSGTKERNAVFIMTVPRPVNCRCVRCFHRFSPHRHEVLLLLHNNTFKPCFLFSVVKYGSKFSGGFSQVYINTLTIQTCRWCRGKNAHHHIKALSKTLFSQHNLTPGWLVAFAPCLF